jgi:hypothetical protein
VFSAADEKASIEKVTGIGGLFFRSEDPGSLAKWHAKHLGVSLVPSSYEERELWPGLVVTQITSCPSTQSLDTTRIERSTTSGWSKNGTHAHNNA